jgi:hypothetical protein
LANPGTEQSELPGNLVRQIPMLELVAAHALVQFRNQKRQTSNVLILARFF